MVQRYGDILDGKRTWQDELMRGNVIPTLPDAVAGDITSAMPYRAMMNIINFIAAVDKVVPGFASGETLLYSPELKFYSNKVKMDEDPLRQKGRQRRSEDRRSPASGNHPINEKDAALAASFV